MTEEQFEMLQEWKMDARLLLHAYFNLAASYNRKNICLGVPAVIMSAIVGTSVFATIGNKPGIWVQVAIGITSVSASVFTALQTFLKFSELKQKSLKTASSYASLRKEIEEILNFPPSPEEELNKRVSEIRIKWEAIREDCLPLTSKELQKYGRVKTS